MRAFELHLTRLICPASLPPEDGAPPAIAAPAHTAGIGSLAAGPQSKAANKQHAHRFNVGDLVMVTGSKTAVRPLDTPRNGIYPLTPSPAGGTGVGGEGGRRQDLGQQRDLQTASPSPDPLPQGGRRLFFRQKTPEKSTTLVKSGS